MLSPESLWALSTGGSSVAADPDSSTLDDVSGPEPAGVAEACAWMSGALATPSAGSHLLFLIGGPGGGKSRAAANLVAGLTEEMPANDGLVRRRYTYTTEHSRTVVLINDATIDKDQAEGSSSPWGLAHDIQEAISRGDHLIACVNRGVLIDEVSAMRGRDSNADLLRWLAGSVDGGQEPASTSYLRQRPIANGSGPSALATVVYVDMCSLLESRPRTRVNSGDLNSGEYEVMRFAGADRTETPAGQLVSSVASSFHWSGDAPPSWDPVRANIESLREAPVLSGMLSVLRAGEIIGGQRLTYRELWGCVGRAIAGDLPSLVNAGEAGSFLASSGYGEDDVLTFDQMRALARHRWFVSVFGGLEPLPDGAAADPVLRVTSHSDPLLDASPEWATPVSDAFASSVLSSSPLEEVRSQLGDERGGAIQPFDEALDAAFIQHLENSTSHQVRASAESWYGRYLTRLYATALGYPPFHLAVEEWVNSYRMAPAVSDGLRPLLHTLLSPSRLVKGHASQPLVPLFASRTDPLVGYIEQPTLARRAQTFEFRTNREGEDLRLSVIEQGVAVGEILLDFALVREAMTCSHDWMGMTEASDRTSPRVERLRSQRLTSSALARDLQLALALGDEDFTVTVAKQVKHD